MRVLMVAFAVLVLALAATGCGSSGGSGGSSESGTKYTCTMCAGTYDKPGECPSCGMDLTEKK